MKRALLSLMALGCIAASPAAAQHGRLSLGAGGMMPSGAYSTVDKTGWQLMGAVELTLPDTPLALRVDAMWGQAGHQNAVLFPGSSKLNGGTVDLVCRLGAPMVPVLLYVMGGVGYYAVNVGGGWDSNLAYAGGAGLSFGAGSTRVFVEGRFISVRASGGAMNFFPVTAGLSFGS
jgi:hypothetical protein